jgi:hypothetical protein
MENIEKNFTYQRPTDDMVPKFTVLREKAKELAILIDENCIDCREKSLAITKVEEAIMWINAGIVRNKKEV